MIYILIIGCILALIYCIFKKQLKVISLNIVVGVVIIYIINMIYPDIKIGINPITITSVGMMGIPGITMLYISRMIL